jgi:Raf kinase inhibitor-like YbhB/YbcL family protein
MSRRNLVSSGAIALMFGAVSAGAAWAQFGPGGGFGGGGPPPGVIVNGVPVGGSTGVPKAPPPSKPLAIGEVPARNGAKLTITSPAFLDGKDIPGENTQYQFNLFPGLNWSAGPAGTKSYVVILQDAEIAMENGAPNLYFSIYNIPAAVTSLKRNFDPKRPPQGATYGPNYYGRSQSYLGPRVPPGPKHHFHFEVFAMDDVLNNENIANYDDLVNSMRGHVLASGAIVGVSSADLDAGAQPGGGRGPGGPGGGGGGGRGG